MLDTNRVYWTTHITGPSTRRISFSGSQLVWQYFPGQGLQFHPLANFAKLNALWSSKSNTAAGQLLDELLPLRVPRAGGVAWEYDFAFGGGRPPWVSGMAQGTGVEAMSRVAKRLGRQDEVLPILKQALGIFRTNTPEGVRVPTSDGPEYALYSFAPDLHVINGFLQALIGLYDLAKYGGDADAQALYAEGERVARREVPNYDTGAWSLYSRGSSEHESDLSYHQLVTSFLHNLCTRTQEPVYCDTELKFTQYQMEAPVISLATATLRGGKLGKVKIRLSKISRVGAEVLAQRPAGLHQARRGRGAREAGAELAGAAQGGRVRRRADGDRPGGERRDGRGYDRRLEAQEARPLRPRTILYTGKGGVGKTSVAAATARRCAAAGQRTIVLSTDPAHSLAESLEARVGSEPTDVGGGLWAQQVQAQDELERNWSAVQGWLGGLFVDQGVDRIAAEELTVPPGGDELFSLLQIKRHVDEGDWDVVIVDCAPTGETLRLLSFPDVARWWLDKVFGRERALLAAARPLAKTFFDVSLPDERVFAEVQRLVENLIAMNDILRDREAVSIRLVMTPDKMVIAEAMRTFTYLSLYGYLTDAVVVNRVFPEEVEGGYFGAWRAVQREQLELVESGFAPVPVLKAPYFEQEVVGAGDARPAGRGAVRGRRRQRAAARRARPGAVARRRRGAAAARPAVRPEGRHLAEEDRVGVSRARGWAETHDHPAARPRPLLAVVGHVRRRLAAGELQWLTTRSPRCAPRSTRPTPPPTGSCARPRPPRGPAAARCRRPATRASGRAPSAPRSATCRRWRGCWRPRARRCLRSWRASSPRPRASCCWRCAR